MASQWEDFLVAVGGGYLRNPLRSAYVTCAICTTPVTGYKRCYPCNTHRSQPGLADATAFLTYAVAGQESGYLMRGYKARPPVAEHQLVVGLLLRGSSSHAGSVPSTSLAPCHCRRRRTSC